jgi:hypothetical protein
VEAFSDMPFVITHPRRGARAALALAGATVALALGAAPAVASTLPYDDEAPVDVVAPATAEQTDVLPADAPSADVCTPASPSKPFTPWGDTNDYTLVRGGDMEDGAPGWTLGVGADLVDGNNLFRVGDRSDRTALRVRAGASALSAPVCIDATYSSFRFFARATSPRADLQVEVIWWESGARHIATLRVDSRTDFLWSPVAPIALPSEYLSGDALEPVQFRFTVTGTSGAWLLDDLYVDPFSRG